MGERRRHYRTAESNREEKRMFRKKQQLLPHLPFFDTMRVTHTISVTVESKFIYTQYLQTIISFQSNKYLCLSYIYRTCRVQNYYTHTTKSNKKLKKKKKKKKFVKKIKKKKKKKKKS